MPARQRPVVLLTRVTGIPGLGSGSCVHNHNVSAEPGSFSQSHRRPRPTCAYRDRLLSHVSHAADVMPFKQANLTVKAPEPVVPEATNCCLCSKPCDLDLDETITIVRPTPCAARKQLCAETAQKCNSQLPFPDCSRPIYPNHSLRCRSVRPRSPVVPSSVTSSAWIEF